MNAVPLAGKRQPRVDRALCRRVALLTVAFYTAWAAAYLAAGHDVRDFIRIGTAFIEQGDGRSHTIRLDPGYRPPANQNPSAHGLGYDGQFSYYIAVDPTHARYYLDDPSYRYSRILYPMLARFLALARPTAIPWTLLLVNLLAIGAGTWALAIWLSRRRVSPRWALLYGLWPGMVLGVQRDLTETLAYGLVVVGWLMLDRRGRWRLPLAGVVFGLAGLARQTTLIFPLIYGLWLALGGDSVDTPPLRRKHPWGAAITFLGLSLGPLVAYQIFVYVWLGSWSNGGNLTPVPFAGLVHGPYRISRQGIELAFVVLPAFVTLAAFTPRRRASAHDWWLPWLLILANVLLNLVFFARFYSVTYTSVSREAIGIVLSGLMCLPYLGELEARRRRWLASAATVAMTMLPVVAVYGFTNVSA